MGNKLHFVTKRGRFPGPYKKNIQGFDFEDDKTKLELGVRDGETWINFCNYRVDIAVLQDAAIKHGEKIMSN